jgi:3-oxoacyl-[acyl-carrier protein] reductase
MKKIAITGSTGNIGQSMVEYFKSQKYQVIELSRNEIDLSEDVPFTKFLKNNSDFQVDYWINNAAWQPVSTLKEMNENDLGKLFQINLLSIFNFYHELANLNFVSESVLNISSIEANTARVGHSHYAASKAALESLTKSAALELAPIRSNTLQLGLVERENIAKDWPEGVTAWLNSVPLNKVIPPAKIGESAEFLLTNTLITGSTLLLDAGNSVYPNW